MAHHADHNDDDDDDDDGEYEDFMMSISSSKTIVFSKLSIMNFGYFN